jgi:ABC-type polysaccharide/polyol phosphate transport system ATPase subunit
MTSELAISVSAVSKTYRVYKQPIHRLKQIILPNSQNSNNEFCALKDISFDIRKGETVGIVGRNGSGKSTLLQIICGTLTPSTGSVKRCGRISALLELGSGFNHQFTGRENVYLSASIAGMSRTEIQDRFEQIEEFADIGRFIDEPVKNYSSGMFARLAFAVAIHVEPQILIIDEILAVGDAAFQRKCINKFYEIRDSGCAILFVSHSDYQVKSICNRALYLEQGRQKMFCDAGKVIDQYNIDIQEASKPKSSSNEGHSLLTTACKTENSKTNVNQNPIESLPHLFEIEEVVLTDEKGNECSSFTTGSELHLSFTFRALTINLPQNISFVFNLYRHDNLYICGTTTAMDGLEPFNSVKVGRVTINFPNFNLLSGKYLWRVGINDSGGWVTLAEKKGICEFYVEDKFQAIGMFNIDRKWNFTILEN